MLSIQGLHLRAAFFRSVRSYFTRQGFLEVDTPLRLPVIIPESTIVPVRSGDRFLQSSPEQCMKRLLARSCEKIFQICQCFRGEESGRRHLTEFTMLEWYRRDADYLALMADCESLLKTVACDLAEHGAAGLNPDGSRLGNVRLNVPWERLTVEQAFERFCPIALGQALADDRFDELLVEYIEPRLGGNRPTLLYDYPASLASLARIKPGEPTVAERFELYIAGVELANGFSELTDVSEQRRRFEVERRVLQDQIADRISLPEQFLDDLELLDSAAGIAFGLDRLLMLVMSADSIDQVVSFAPADLL